MRINKYIASAGISSRRKADELILSGKVKINGKVVTELGTQVDEKKDVVHVESIKLKLDNKKIYILLNKPEGYVTTAKDQFDRPSVMDLIKEKNRVFPVGRLDMYTSGLLILTNDGEFANKLIHPKHMIEKTYYVKVKGDITDETVINLTRGVDIGEYITKEAKVVELSENELEIHIFEGKNRQIRKMCESQNLEVKKLIRTKIGNLGLGNLKQGQYIYLDEKELSMIFKK